MVVFLQRKVYIFFSDKKLTYGLPLWFSHGMLYNRDIPKEFVLFIFDDSDQAL